MIRKALIRLTGNSQAQKILEKTVTVSQVFMGIGSGGVAESSDEKAILKLLQLKYNPPYYIFDVCSNQGQYLKLIAQIFQNSDLYVHCFEPSKYTFDSSN